MKNEKCKTGQWLQPPCRRLPPDRIDTTDCRTRRDAGPFVSHRRDNGVTGRMAAVVSPKAC